MRMDYELYVLSIIVFIAAAVFAVVLTDWTIWTGTAVILGAVFIVGGYIVRPKSQVAGVPPPAEPQPDVTTPPEPQPPISVPSETQVVEPLKAESVVKTSVAESPPMIEALKVETPALEKPAPTQALPPAPVTEAPPIVVAPPFHSTDLTQIRGINERRVEQLKALGIESIKDLATASAADLSSKLKVSEKIVKMWIGSAKKQVK
jgi:predicted flap endonuclease-1-like 5' DNA nuclease